MNLTPKQKKAFENAVEEVIKWLCENAHPHCSVRIDCDMAELLEGQLAHQTTKYVKG
jgi:hypothetical protein